MGTVRQYILSVICCSLLCGLIQLLSLEGTTGKVIKVIIGLVMTLTVLNPLMQGNMFHWDVSFDSLLEESEIAVWEGQEMAETAYKKHIQEKTEAYILDKAAAWNADFEVSVDLREDYPYEVELVHIKGTAVPYVKMAMLQTIRTELGIAEDDLLWTS